MRMNKRGTLFVVFSACFVGLSLGERRSFSNGVRKRHRPSSRHRLNSSHFFQLHQYRALPVSQPWLEDDDRELSDEGYNTPTDNETETQDVDRQRDDRTFGIRSPSRFTPNGNNIKNRSLNIDIHPDIFWSKSGKKLRHYPSVEADAGADFDQTDNDCGDGDEGNGCRDVSDWRDYPGDVPTKRNHMTVLRNLSSSQLTLLVVGLFFGFIIIGSLCMHLPSKAKRSKDFPGDLPDTTTSCSRELESCPSPKNTAFCPRPLFPQAYPGQDWNAVDQQPFISGCLPDSDEQSDGFDTVIIDGKAPETPTKSL